MLSIALIFFFVLIFQTQPPNPFDLPIVAALGAAVALPAKVIVDVAKGALPGLPGGFLPGLGLLVAFVLALTFQVAIKTPLETSLIAQCMLAAIAAQGAAMVATSTQNWANDKRS